MNSSRADADESSFIDLVIASERVDKWLAEIKSHGNNPVRLKHAIKELAKAVQSKEAYAEEARRAGAVPALTRLLKRADEFDDELVSDIGNVIACCSGPMATGNKICTFTFGGQTVTVKESALGDGVGAKVWTMAHFLCNYLVLNTDLLKDKTVLELGAGCGLCGLLAANLGAKHIVLSDYVDTLLHNLQQGMMLTFQEKDVNNSVELGKKVYDNNLEEELEDPEDASECSDLDDFFGGGGSDDEETRAAKDAGIEWDQGNVSVRFVDWTDSLHVLDNEKAVASNDDTNNPLDGPSTRTTAPGLAVNDTYEVIIGSEVLYEPSMARTLAAAIKHRLAENGHAVLGCAVRDSAMFDDFYKNLKDLGLNARVESVEPSEDVANGTVGTRAANDYEGGFVMIYIEHS